MSIRKTGVVFVRPELERVLPQYEVISDCLAGEAKVKFRREKYLPNPEEGSQSKDSKSRYSAYLNRAVFYNATRRTLDGLVGEVFAKPVSVSVPTQMDPIVKSASGDGISIEQQSRRALELVLSHSRAGLLVDYPARETPATREEINSGKVRPTITLYEASQITNWKVEDIDSEEVVTMVVLLEEVERPALGLDGKIDRFAVELVPQYRVLWLEDDGAWVSVWSVKAGYPTSRMIDFQSFEEGERLPIINGDGKPLDRLPFFFIGGKYNSCNIEDPSFYDLASLNLSHYRNSADYEESVFVIGQPTLWVSGLTDEWVKNHGASIKFGSRSGIKLGRDMQIGIEQVQPNSMAKEAMDAKERQMVMLGAKLVEEPAAAMTATQAKIEATAEGSVLQNAARNVSAAYLWALNLCASLLNIQVAEQTSEDETIEGGISFDLNDDFDIAKLSSEELNTLMQTQQGGGLTWSEWRKALRAKGWAYLDDEAAKKEISEKQKEADAFEVDKAKALAAAEGNGDDAPTE